MANYLAMFGDLFGNRFQWKARLGLNLPNDSPTFAK
jgi:hypothetical protein